MTAAREGRPPQAEKGKTPAETEVPAGPGDAGASDKPRLLKKKPRRHPARRKYDILILVVLVVGATLLSLLFSLL